MEQKSKGFASKLGFILAAAGSAVGLGNIWRFPYQVGKYGGGAFVLVYILAVLMLGTVVMIAEMYLGKRAQNNVVDAYGKVNKYMKWAGMLAVAVPFIIATYYGVIGGWTTGYAMNYVLQPSLIQAGGAGGAFVGFISDHFLPLLFLVLFMVVAILIVCGGVAKGIEKANKFMMPALFVLLLVTVIFSLCLPGKGAGATVSDGLKFYLGKFDFKALGWDGVTAAMGQAFFSLSLGMGAMIAYGSYTGKKTNLGKSALIVCGLDTLVALLAGFAIFPAMYATGNAALTSTAGASLLFIALPEVFAVMPGGSFLGFMFFALVIFAALTSIISLLEVVSQYFIKKLNWTRMKATMVFGGIITTIGVFVSLSQGAVPYTIFKMDLLTYFDEVTNVIVMPILAFIAVVTVGWVIKPKNVFAELEAMESTFKFQKVWAFMAQFVTPILILVVLVMGVVGKFQSMGKGYGYVLLGAGVLVVAAIVWNFVTENAKYQAKVLARKAEEASEEAAE